MQNLEAKFRLSDLERARWQAEAIGYRYAATLRQRDTFFRVALGKLKLREEESGAWLIYYDREDRGDLKLSNYEIVPTPEPEKTRAMLTQALGTIAVVEKERILMMRDHIRFHLDDVEGLGEFGEIEAVLADAGDLERSRPMVDQLLGALGIKPVELIEVSYFELAMR
ncbi:MAG TPA: class IV adenylate cyclase [Candidatus Binataceae bacterium]|nr:class IV adenylate cyclase [Candidatus Binataceae bacterium]